MPLCPQQVMPPVYCKYPWAPHLSSLSQTPARFSCALKLSWKLHKVQIPGPAPEIPTQEVEFGHPGDYDIVRSRGQDGPKPAGLRACGCEPRSSPRPSPAPVPGLQQPGSSLHTESLQRFALPAAAHPFAPVFLESVTHELPPRLQTFSRAGGQAMGQKNPSPSWPT